MQGALFDHLCSRVFRKYTSFGFLLHWGLEFTKPHNWVHLPVESSQYHHKHTSKPIYKALIAQLRAIGHHIVFVLLSIQYSTLFFIFSAIFMICTYINTISLPPKLTVSDEMRNLSSVFTSR